MNFGTKSEGFLACVHEDLQKVMHKAIEAPPYAFSITDGLRTLERQKELVAAGKSKTMNSRHLTGKAVDVCVLIDGKASWEFHKYEELAQHILGVAKELTIPLVWGGTFKGFKDGPHIELDRKVYP